MSTAIDNPLARLRQRPRDNAAVYTVLVIGSLLWAFPLISAVRQSVAHGGFGNYLTVLTGEFNQVSLIRAFGNSLVIAALHAVDRSMENSAIARMQFLEVHLMRLG